MSENNKYYVCGDGIYRFSLLPKDLQIFHDTYAEAINFIGVVAERMNQSFLYFRVGRIDHD